MPLLMKMLLSMGRPTSTKGNVMSLLNFQDLVDHILGSLILKVVSIVKLHQPPQLHQQHQLLPPHLLQLHRVVLALIFVFKLIYHHSVHTLETTVKVHFLTTDQHTLVMV
jgi:hypothetical protein